MWMEFLFLEVSASEEQKGKSLLRSMLVRTKYLSSAYALACKPLLLSMPGMYLASNLLVYRNGS